MPQLPDGPVEVVVMDNWKVLSAHMVENELREYKHAELTARAELDVPSMYPEQCALYEKILSDVEHE
jgi:hypothetical protein